MFTRFYLLQNEIGQFMDMQGNPVVELSDNRWLCDLAFMVDISKHFSQLNIKLQGPNQLLNSMFAKIKSFETKSQLWKVQLQNNTTTHFPSLQEQKPSTTAKYALECAKISEIFSVRFQDMKSKQMELDIFATPFNVVAAAAPNNFQHEIIELQTNNTLKSMYLKTPLVEFYQCYVTADDFPILCKHALKYVSLFGSTYCCKQFFSKLNLAKSQFRFRISDENLGQQLRIATSSASVDIARLTKEKNF